MILTGAIIAGVIATYVAIACFEAYRLKIAFRQALLYAPFKFIWQVDDRGILTASQSDAPVIYVVAHQSKLEPAMMLALLPAPLPPCAIAAAPSMTPAQARPRLSHLFT